MLRTLFLLLLFSSNHARANEGADRFKNVATSAFKERLLLIKERDPAQNFEPARNLAEYAGTFINRYERAPDKCSDKALVISAIAYGAVGRLEESGKLLERASKVGGEDPAVISMLGMTFYGRGILPEAIRNYKAAWKINYLPALTLLGECYLESKETNELDALQPEMLKHIPEDESIRHFLVIKSQANDPPDMELFLKLAGDLGDSRIGKIGADNIPFYAKGFWNAGKRKLALRLMASLRDPSFYHPFLGTAKIRTALLNEYELDKAEFTDADLPLVGTGYIMEKQGANARDVYQKFAHAQPKDAYGWEGLGVANQLLSNWKEAIASFKKAMDLGSADAVKWLATSYIASGEIEKIKALLPQLIKNMEADSEVASFLAVYAITVKLSICRSASRQVMNGRSLFCKNRAWSS